MYVIYRKDGEFTVTEDQLKNNRCPQCDGVGSVSVRVIHIYPDGDEVDAGDDIVYCTYCDATGKLYKED